MFELSTALSYLIPRKGRLSQSVTTLIAVLVISTIVWLSLVYFSTIEHIEERWTKKIQGVTGAYEILPTEAYLKTPSSNIDRKRPLYNYTVPRLSLHAQEETPSWDEDQDGPLEKNLLQGLKDPLPLHRLLNLLQKQSSPFSWHIFEQQVAHAQVYTQDGTLSQYVMVIGSNDSSSLIPMLLTYNQLDDTEVRSYLHYIDTIQPLQKSTVKTPLVLELNIAEKSNIHLESFIDTNNHFLFRNKDTNTTYTVQTILQQGSHLHLKNTEPCLLAESTNLFSVSNIGYPFILPLQMRKQGIKLTDSLALDSSQENKSSSMSQIKGFVAGFYDPGILPIGSKLLLCSSEVVTLLSPSLLLNEPISSSGIVVDNPGSFTKKELSNLLTENNLGDIFFVRAYDEAPMTKEVFDQLKNEHTLFQLLSSIFLFVASANILSMLFLIARDRKKELALFRALGLKRKRICLLFTLAGFLTGAFSLLLALILSSLTLHFLPECLSLISWAQGRDVLDPAIFGAIGPSEVSLNSILFCGFFVLLSSTLAGLGASLYATRISISEALKEP